MTNPWQGLHLTFHRDRPIEDVLHNVEWIVVRNDDGSEDHWAVKVREVTNAEYTGIYTVHFTDAFTDDTND